MKHTYYVSVFVEFQEEFKFFNSFLSSEHAKINRELISEIENDFKNDDPALNVVVLGITRMEE